MQEIVLIRQTHGANIHENRLMYSSMVVMQIIVQTAHA